MLESEKVAIAAHLHVLIRRKTGRVTDTEWMASNAVYAREIVRFARQRAAEDGVPELADWALRLEKAVLGADADAKVMAVLGEGRGGSAPVEPVDRYVGGLR